MVSYQVRSGLLMGFGSFTVVAGAILVVFWPSMFFAQLRRMMTLSPTSTSFDIWREVPIPMYLECFMFNITNVDDILAGKNVPIHVEQMGPYVFREYHLKENISWYDNSTVSYYNKRSWQFQPEMSNGSLSDLVTSINPIVATVSYILRHQHAVLRVAVEVFMRMYHENMFMTANVTSWLFDGIEDPVLDIAQRFPDLPFKIPYDKFGWFYERNNSLEYDGIFLMNTGAADFSQLGNVEKWKFSNRTVFRDECGEVRGSTGELWAPELGQPEVTIFAPDICTYMILPATGPVHVQGIDGVQYAANNSLFDNGYRYPHQACYCAEVRDADCLPSGALNVSACRYGAPAFVSQPHFYNMDPHYPSKIRGLKPTDDMNFKLSLEMYTGMPLQVSAQLQINLLVRHVDAIPLNNQLPDPDVLVPMFWFRQEVIMDDHFARLARFALNLRSGMPYGFYALTVVGVILLVAGITILIRKLLRSPDEPILDNQREDTQ
ncbi:protein croquemort [Bicyclus anynana]|uniref:Protein croquemort n=1 Tax=Bicyclus anynana TaxID=110368 RepID=A0ABM3LJN5_BICAN|nr:protein croquemort [Bicyclus anynana]